MYVILTNDDNTLSAPKKERIMQRSKLVDELWFLAPPSYQGHDMSGATVLLEYLLPVSKKYGSMILRRADEGYEEYLKYLLPDNDDIDTDLTSEAGKVELQLTFIYVDLGVDGEPIQRVRKTSAITINIVPITAWSDIIPDAALSALDQRLIKADAQMKALEEAHKLLNESKADNLKYDDENSTLQLLSGDKEIGDKVTIKSCTGVVSEDGIPVIDFGDSTSGGSSDDNDDDIVEF